MTGNKAGPEPGLLKMLRRKFDRSPLDPGDTKYKVMAWVEELV